MEQMRHTLNNGFDNFCMRSCRRNSHLKLSVTDFNADLPEQLSETDLVEVQFKNTRKAYFHNTLHLPLEKGVLVAVEASPGHDIGEVTLTGRLVEKQIQKNHLDLTRYIATSIVLQHPPICKKPKKPTKKNSRQ